MEEAKSEVAKTEKSFLLATEASSVSKKNAFGIAFVSAHSIFFRCDSSSKIKTWLESHGLPIEVKNI